MAKSTGLVLAAGAIAAANEAFFAPLASTRPGDETLTVDKALRAFNWRIIPATLVLALILGGLEKLSEPLAVGLAGLSLGVVIITPMGNSQDVLTNVMDVLGVKK